MTDPERWPTIRVADWQDTRDTLHLYTQVVGKVRLANEPRVNHWWNVPLYVSARGLTTSLMPHPTGPAFQIDFDFVDHAADTGRAHRVRRVCSTPMPSQPSGYSDTPIRPMGARWDDDLAEFVLPYELVRTAADPDALLLEFLQSTYEAAAVTADWDRAALERPAARPSDA